MHMSGNKNILITLLLVGAVIVLFIVYVFFMPNISPKGEKVTFLLIPDNTAYSEVIDQLEEKADISSKFSFKLAAKILKLNEIKSGRYKISKGTANFRLIRNLKNGHQTPVQLKLNNIRTKEQLAGKLAAQLMPDSAKFLSMLS
ncbi:MAG: aminodeoxychorismate lyase, partial [Bacteroidetes bacterium]|nr:aminodeoxychorismate lyase [Bacteroidota bacterium]